MNSLTSTTGFEPQLPANTSHDSLKREPEPVASKEEAALFGVRTVNPLPHGHGLKWSLPPMSGSNVPLALRPVRKLMGEDNHSVETAINELWELLNKQVYWLSSLPDDAKADFRSFIHNNFDPSEITNTCRQELADRLMSEMMMFSPGPESIIGKHLAKRPKDEWDDTLKYGDPSVWDEEFELTVETGLLKLRHNDLDAEGLVDFCRDRRREIAEKLGDLEAYRFGLETRDSIVTFLSSPAYRHAISQAVETKPNGEDYIETYNKDGLIIRKIQGFIDGKPVGLTELELWLCPLKENDLFRLRYKKFFKHACTYTNDHMGKIENTFYCPAWISPEGKEAIPEILPHIYKLIEKAIAGDLSQIPRIHWWYVQLAPVRQGPGGIAEMVTNTICRLHRIDLPPWAEGVAPSVKVLVEPSEERFCQNYHKLFSAGQEQLEKIFRPQTPPATEAHTSAST